MTGAARVRTTTQAALMLGAMAAAAPIWAQDTGPRGIQLRFGVGLGLEAQSNRRLDPDDPGHSVEASVDLSFGLLTETRTESLSFDARTSLRDISGEAGDTISAGGFDVPALSFGYTRTARNASLSLGASYSESDLADGDSLIFDETTGLFTIVNGTATRRNTTADAALNWGLDSPVQYGISARLARTEYSDGTAVGVGGNTLNDTERLTLRGSLGLDITKVMRLDTVLSYSVFEEEGEPDDRETLALNNTLTIDRPLGALTFTLGLTDTEDGNRVSASVGRSLDYPLGTLTGRLGLTRGTGGETFFNGALTASRALPQGNVDVSLVRSVSSGDEQDNEQINTSLRLNYTRELTPLSNLALGISYADAQNTATDLGTRNAIVSATYRRELTRDWGMRLGLRHRYRDEDTTGSARSNEVFFSLDRSFLTRF